MTTKMAYIISVLTSMGLLFIGARFLFDPVTAEHACGIRLDTGGDFSFHYIKGIRDIFSSLLLLILVIYNQRKALGLALITATIIPLGDLLIVLNKNSSFLAAVPHLIAVLTCVVTGLLLLAAKKASSGASLSTKRPVEIISSAKNSPETVMISCVLPGDKTPWHYHTRFTERFEVITGSLLVGKNKQLHQLQKGNIITIEAGESHLFHNNTQEECHIRTTISPGDTDFENASLILTGLAGEGLTNKEGIPKNLTDRALFLHLNNSRLMGWLRIATPLISYLAQRGIKTGRLDTLISRYC